MELFEEFNGVSYQEWIDQITIDLKGKDFNDNLVWNSNEGIEVQPFYNRSHLKDNPLVGATPLKQNPDWKICETIVITSPEQTNKKALSALKGGANSLLFIGKINTNEKMSILLKDIMYDIVDLNFYSSNPNQIKSIAKELSITCKSIGYDYLGELLVKGKWIKNKNQDIADLVKLTTSDTYSLSATVKGIYYANVGTTTIQELAFSLAQGVEYMNILTDNGLTPEEASNNISFHFGIRSNYFFEIAKLRAARILWNLILAQYKITDGSMFIHSETSDYKQPEKNTHLNMLRGTTEAMSAIIGGCDSLSVLPYDKSIAISERIARNVQHILKEESFMGKVKNPADGSYYIEYLTDQITQKAWGLFKVIENKGGFISCVENGFIKSQMQPVNSLKSIEN